MSKPKAKPEVKLMSPDERKALMKEFRKVIKPEVERVLEQRYEDAVNDAETFAETHDKFRIKMKKLIEKHDAVTEKELNKSERAKFMAERAEAGQERFKKSLQKSVVKENKMMAKRAAKMGLKADADIEDDEGEDAADEDGDEGKPQKAKKQNVEESDLEDSDEEEEEIEEDMPDIVFNDYKEEDEKEAAKNFIDDDDDNNVLAQKYTALMSAAAAIKESIRNLPEKFLKTEEAIRKGNTTAFKIRDGYGITQSLEWYSEFRVEQPAYELNPKETRIPAEKAVRSGPYAISVNLKQMLRDLVEDHPNADAQSPIKYLLVHRICKKQKTEGSEDTPETLRNDSWLVMAAQPEHDSAFRRPDVAAPVSVPITEEGSVAGVEKKKEVWNSKIVLSELKKIESGASGTRQGLPEWLLSLAGVCATWWTPTECDIFLSILSSQQEISIMPKSHFERYTKLAEEARAAEEKEGEKFKLDQFLLAEDNEFLDGLKLSDIPASNVFKLFSERLSEQEFFSKNMFTVIPINSGASAEALAAQIWQNNPKAHEHKFLEIKVPEVELLSWKLFKGDGTTPQKMITSVGISVDLGIQLFMPNVTEILRLLFSQAFYRFSTNRADSVEFFDQKITGYSLDCTLASYNPVEGPATSLTRGLWNFRGANFLVGVVLYHPALKFLMPLGFDDCMYGLYLFALAYQGFVEIQKVAPEKIHPTISTRMNLLTETLCNGMRFAIGDSTVTNYDRTLFMSVFGGPPELFVSCLGSADLKLSLEGNLKDGNLKSKHPFVYCFDISKS